MCIYITIYTYMTNVVVAPSSTQSVTSHITTTIRMSTLLERFMELARVEELYFLGRDTETIAICNWLHPIPLSLTERYVRY